MGAVEQALATACQGAAPDGLRRTAGGLADAVVRHGATFAPGTEPAYHDRQHQAEATLAAAALAHEARRAGLIGDSEAALLVAAAIGHDLLHDGSIAGPPGRLERISADAAGRIAATAGLAPDLVQELRRLILATEPSARPAADDLAARLLREADLMGSLMPRLGWHLSARLAAERAKAGAADTPAVDSFRGRLRLLRGAGAETLPARALGIERVRRDQIAAFAAAAGTRTPEDGAARLDAATRQTAMRNYCAALRQLSGATP